MDQERQELIQGRRISMDIFSNLLTNSKDKLQCYSAPFPHFIIDDFLPCEVVESATKVARDMLRNSTRIFHGNRKFVPNTSRLFVNLLNQSAEWRSLHKYLTSQTFCDELKNCFMDIDPDFYRKNVKQYEVLVRDLIKLRSSNLDLKLEEIGTRPLNLSSLKGAIAYHMYQYYKVLALKCKAHLTVLITKKKVAQLLFDISLAGNGYQREIHRDSDNRLFVFLLYLSELDDNGRGGALGLHAAKTTDDSVVIEPKTNRLVAFLNSEVSFHSVKKMDKYENDRLFCYGAFTTLSNKPILNLRSRSRTDFNLYL